MITLPSRTASLSIMSGFVLVRRFPWHTSLLEIVTGGKCARTVEAEVGETQNHKSPQHIAGDLVV
ncbi:hypothetical protein CFAEC_09470 [Corynebacterium faecale]|nr:hypothetical protein CFAEC_09470 [Corynebacterium faecale]